MTHFVGSHPDIVPCPRCGRTFTSVGMPRHTAFCDKVPPPSVLAMEWANMKGRKSAAKLARQHGVTACHAFLQHLAEGKRQIGQPILDTERGKQGQKPPTVANSVHCLCGLVIPDTEERCEYCKGNDAAGYAIVKSGHKAVMQGNLSHVVEWLDRQGARYKLARVFSARVEGAEYIVKIM